MNRWTTIGYLMRQGEREAARREIRHALIQTNGDVRKAAWLLWITRKRLYEWIGDLGMFPVVDACRRRAELSTWAAITAAVLKRGQPMPPWEKVMRGIQGLTAEDVATQLSASKFASRIPDVQAFAEGLVAAAAEWQPPEE